MVSEGKVKVNTARATSAAWGKGCSGSCHAASSRVGQPSS